MSKEVHLELTPEDVSTIRKKSSKKNMSELDKQILSFLKKSGPITRYDLVTMTGIARSTLYDSLTRLILKGLVKKYTENIHTTKGRPKVFFEALSK